MSNDQRVGAQFSEGDQRREPRVAPLGGSGDALPDGAMGGGPAGQGALAHERDEVSSDYDAEFESEVGVRAEELVARAHGLMVGPRRGRTRRTVRAEEAARPRVTLSAQQRVLMLDTWLRSKLSARDFASLIGMSEHTLYAWKKRFEQAGPAVHLAEMLRC